MKLKEYFDKERINPVEFAVRLEISPASIYRYMANKTKPAYGRAKLIEKATRGQVSYEDLRGKNA